MTFRDDSDGSLFLILTINMKGGSNMFNNFDYNVKAYVDNDHDGWIIEIVRFKGIIEVWLSHMDYGTKSLLFGIDDNGQNDDEVLSMIDIACEINDMEGGEE